MCEDRLVAEFEIHHRRCLDADGEAVGTLPDFSRDTELMFRLYRLMVLTRKFDEDAVAMQRTGRLGTFASSLGEEAAAVAVGAAMDPDDVLLPSFREQGAMLARGVTPAELFFYWGGDERGSDFETAAGDFPVSIPVGSHAPHAAGVAMAFKLRRERRVAVCTFGDGAMSKGEVYEAMNVAGAWELPVLFVALNNQWAISVPRSAQSRAQTLAQKAVAAGFKGIQVDGNDIIAMYAAVREALAHCRECRGPLLIEALTYRLADHTTADDASRYREDDDVSLAWRQEPVKRCRQYLSAQLGWTRDDEDRVLVQVAAEVEAGRREYLASVPQPAVAMFDHLYAELPAPLESQRQMLAHSAEDVVDD